jgi:hypothetical protein
MQDQPTTAQIQAVFHTSDTVVKCVGVLRHWRHVTTDQNGQEHPTMRGMDGPEGYFYWRITLARLVTGRRYQVTCTGHAFGDCHYGRSLQTADSHGRIAQWNRSTKEERQHEIDRLWFEWEMI